MEIVCNYWIQLSRFGSKLQSKAKPQTERIQLVVKSQFAGVQRLR